MHFLSSAGYYFIIASQQVALEVFPFDFQSGDPANGITTHNAATATTMRILLIIALNERRWLSYYICVGRKSETG